MDGPTWLHLLVLEFVLGIEPKVPKMIAQVWGRFPRNTPLGIQVPHRKTIGFEFSQHFRQNQVSVQKIAGPPESSLLVGLLDDFSENFVHSAFHVGQLMLAGMIAQGFSEQRFGVNKISDFRRSANR